MSFLSDFRRDSWEPLTHLRCPGHLCRFHYDARPALLPLLSIQYPRFEKDAILQTHPAIKSNKDQAGEGTGKENVARKTAKRPRVLTEVVKITPVPARTRTTAALAPTPKAIAPAPVANFDECSTPSPLSYDLTDAEIAEVIMDLRNDPLMPQVYDQLSPLLTSADPHFGNLPDFSTHKAQFRADIDRFLEAIDNQALHRIHGEQPQSAFDLGPSRQVKILELFSFLSSSNFSHYFSLTKIRRVTLDSSSNCCRLGIGPVIQLVETRTKTLPTRPNSIRDGTLIFKKFTCYTRICTL